MEFYLKAAVLREQETGMPIKKMASIAMLALGKSNAVGCKVEAV